MRKGKERTKEMQGLGNRLSECLVSGKSPDYLRNTSRETLVCGKEGEWHGGARSGGTSCENVGPSGEGLERPDSFLN